MIFLDLDLNLQNDYKNDIPSLNSWELTEFSENRLVIQLNLINKLSVLSGHYKDTVIFKVV